MKLEAGKAYIVRRQWEMKCSFRVESIVGDVLVGTFVGTGSKPVTAQFGLKTFLQKYEILGEVDLTGNRGILEDINAERRIQNTN